MFKRLKEFGIYSAALIGCMAFGWMICVIGLGILGVL